MASIGTGDEWCVDTKIRVGHGFAGLIAAERRPLEINEEELNRIVQPPLLSNLGVRALYGVPLLHEGQVLGVAHIGSTRASGFTDAEKRIFTAAAERASVAVAKRLEVSLLNEVLESAPAFIAILRASTGEYTFANAPMRKLFIKTLVGARVEEFGFGSEALRAIESAKVSGQTVEVSELRTQRDDAIATGDLPDYLRFTAQPLRNASGLVDRILVFAIDIAPQVQGRMAVEQAQLARTRLLERERAARRAAESASTAKDEFLATVSHELRTPLNAILGWASITRTHPEADKERALAVIERNARAQARIVEDVLDFSRMSKGKMRLALRTISLSKIVDAALESVRPAAAAKGITIEVDARAKAPLVGDAERLQQVVWNLLSNAVKFSSAGGHVTVSATSDECATSLSVTDYGQGIDPDFLPHVFEPFRQANGSTTRRHGGLGLGLAIVQAYCAGAWGYDSGKERGRGTRCDVHR
ncbi:MAG: GAF domain-containing sensor histidine kinase [Polyangiaceae bacterium]